MNKLGIKKENKLTAYLLFLVWPLFSVLFAVLNYRASYAKNIFWLFCSFFGYTFVVSNEEMDASRYKILLEQYASIPDFTFHEFLTQNFGFGSSAVKYGFTDLYHPLLTYFVSRFTGDFRIFFAIVALIYGYFLSRSIWLLIENSSSKKLQPLTIVILITFATIVPIWHINGLRFYTATQIFLFGALHYLIGKKRKYILITLLSPLAHFSFAFPVFVLFVYSFLGNRLNLYFIFLVSSLMFVSLDPATVQENFLGYSPIFIQHKVKGYTNEDYVNLRSEQKIGMNWYVYGKRMALYSVIYFFTFFAFFFKRKLIEEEKVKPLFCFGMLIFGFANMVSSIPSMGGRFALVASLFMFAFIFVFLDHKKNIRVGNILFFPMLIPLFLFLIVEFRIGCDFAGLQTIMANYMVAPFLDNEVALINLFK